MAVFISVLIILVSILLILVVLVQNSKGGGLASNFASSNQVMGVRKTADVLEKATWTFAAILLVLCLMSSAYTRPSTGTDTEQTEAATKGKTFQGTQPTTPPPSVTPPGGIQPGPTQ
jgi:preprotein translocase subunit SecG